MVEYVSIGLSYRDWVGGVLCGLCRILGCLGYETISVEQIQVAKCLLEGFSDLCIYKDTGWAIDLGIE